MLTFFIVNNFYLHFSFSQTETLHQKEEEVERLKEKIMSLEMQICNESEEKGQYEVI